jgi:Tol biopolymer transport system component
VKTLFDGGTFARYAPTGHVLFSRNAALVASAFDAATLTVGDAREVVVPDLWMDPAVASTNYTVSASGTLVYAAGTGAEFERTIVALDGSTATPLIKDRRYYAEPRMSPRGGAIAVVERAWRDRIWVVDSARETFTRLTSGTDRGSEYAPVWSPDGRVIAFGAGSARTGGDRLYVAPADGSRAETLLHTSAKEPLPTSWTRDGRQLVFTERNAGTNFDLMLLSIDRGNSVRPLLQTPFNEHQAVISPDGQLIAYQSDRSGNRAIYVSHFPSMQGATQVSADGGVSPVWARDRNRLYYKFGRDVMAVDMAPGGLASASRPTVVMTYPFTYPTAFVDPMPDGRFLALQGTEVGTQSELRVVLNWFGELREKGR